MKRQNTRRILAAGLALAASALTASADTLNWDPAHTGGTTGGSGGSGTWNLTTANWFDSTLGAESVWNDSSTNTAAFAGTAGTVTLNTSLLATNLQFLTAGYTLSGSGTLTLDGGIDASTLSSLTTTISTPLALTGQGLWQVGSGSLLAVKGTLARSAGASVDFTTPGISGTSTLLTNDATGVIGGWATVGDLTGSAADWAANDGSGNLVTFTGYTQVSGNQNGAGASTQNWENSGGTIAVTANTIVNSLVQLNDCTIGSGVTLTLGNGGLIQSGVSRWMIAGSGTNSYLTSGSASGELFVHVPENDGNANNWTIWPIIADNGATPVTLVKDGNGQVILGNMNTYSGGTVVNAGTVAYAGSADWGQGSSQTGAVTPFGTGSVTLNPGTALFLGWEIDQGGSVSGQNGQTFDIPNAISVNGGTLFEVDGFMHVQGPLAIGAAGATLGATWNGGGGDLNKGLFVDGVVSGSGNLTVQQSGLDTGEPWNTSIVYFGNTNTYSGTITVVPMTGTAGGGYIGDNSSLALQNATINLPGNNTSSAQQFGTSPLVFATGIGSATLGALTGSADVVLTGYNETTHAYGSDSIALIVGNNNASTTFSGGISGAGSLAKVGAGTLTLSGANTYTGNTTVSGGTLALTSALAGSADISVGGGATLDVSSLTSLTLGAAQSLSSVGTVKGSVSTTAGSQIHTSTGGGYGTNTITGSLTLAASASVYLDLGTVHNGTNDLITVAGTVTAANNIIHLTAPGTSVSLDATADYVLIRSANPIAGSFASAPSWDAAPANAANYSVVTSGNTVTLHHAAATSPSGSGVASPASPTRNQNVLITVTAVNGNGGTVNSVTLDASSIGIFSPVVLVNAGGNVWTNTVAAAPAIAAGSYTLVATLTDTVPLSGVVTIPLTVTVANDVWNGLAGNPSFDSNLNWTNKAAPGFVGDSLEFAGTVNTSPDLDNNYTVTGVTFDSTAGGFTINSAEGDTLTLTGSGTLVNNSVNAQTLNVPIADAGGGVTTTGNGVIVLAGNNTYTGPTTVNAGTLSLTGTAASTANLNVGGVPGNSVLDVSGTISPYYVLLGNVSNSVAAVYQTGGTVSSAENSGYDNLSVGNVQGAIGYYDAIGGTATFDGLCVGGEANNGRTSFTTNGGSGILDINGATVNCTGWLVVNRNGNTQTGILNVYGGALTYAGGGLVCNWGANQTTIINVLGGSLSTTANNEIGFLAGTGLVNLLGGVAQVSAVNGGWDGPNGVISFNGGTLQASADNTAFIAVTSAYLFGGGATIDNNSFAITIAQPLLAPAGNGVNGIASFTGGAGYIAPPIVTVVPGTGDTTGTGASALAQINPLTGVVTNVIITSAGVNYTATPTFTLIGGGCTTPATITGEAPTANTGGGLTAIGSGTTTLAGVSTYTGATVITNGTLALTGNGSISDSTNIMVDNGAIFDVTALTAYTLAGGQTLSGDGTVNGSVTTAAGSLIAAGTPGAYATNTFNNNVTLGSGAACSLNLGAASAGANDLMVVDGTLTASGNIIYLSATSLDTADYVLISSPNTIAGAFNTAPIWKVRPANAGHYSIVTGAKTVTLHYNATMAAPGITASANPTTLASFQSSVITAVVTPGSGAITSVTIDLTPMGGSVVPLVRSGSGTTYTNAITIPPAATPGSDILTVTVTDANGLQASATITLTITTTAEVWQGGAGNENWSTAANWQGGVAPAYSGDSPTFAGSAGLLPNVDTNYSVPSLTFSNNAGAFTIGSANGSTLTLTGSGSLINNSVNPQTLNVTLADAGGGLTKGGNGAITLAGNNTYTGPTIVNAGTLNLTGSATSSYTSVGGTVGDAVLNISGSLTANNFFVGNLNNAAGAVYQTGGSVTVTAGTGGDLLDIGNIAGGYGYYNASGGTLTANGTAVGGENYVGGSFSGTGGNGIMEINGATVNDNGWLVMARGGSAEIGVLNVYSGALTYAGGGLICNFGSGQTAIINILGGSVANSANGGTGVGLGAGTSILNVNGGVLAADLVGSWAPWGYQGNYGRVNFNGGTLQASAASSGFLTVNSACIYSGGATIDNNSFAITIAQPLLAPAGNGVNGITSFTGGAGYIAPPIVIVTNGVGDTTGVGATAIAQINPLTGTVTNVLITCPGVNYTATPVFLVSGGGATTPATITGEAPAANASGGLTAVGSGTTTLTGANSYTGNTTVSAGTLEIAQPVLAASSTVTVASGAALQLDFSGINPVAGLVLNGVSQPAGVYNNSTSPNSITGSGSLQVLAATPPEISASLSGATLTITWPASHIGWILQAQTNSLQVGLSTNWFDVAGSAAGTSSKITVNPAAPAVFYRLSQP